MSTSYTLIDYFNGFQQLKRIKRLSAGVQSTYFAILAEFNLRRFPAELELSTRDLKSLAGLKSVSSAHEARNILKNNKLVDFHTKNGISTYSLGTEHLPNTYRTPTEHYGAEMPNASRTPHALSNSSISSTQMETETKRQDKDLSITVSETHARETLRGITSTGEMDIHEVWEYETGYRLTGSVAYELEELANTDFEGVRQAIIAAVKSKDTARVRYNHFRAIYDGTKKPKRQPLKGGEKSEKREHQYAKPPEYDFLDEWEQRKAANPVE